MAADEMIVRLARLIEGTLVEFFEIETGIIPHIKTVYHDAGGIEITAYYIQSSMPATKVSISAVDDGE